MAAETESVLFSWPDVAKALFKAREIKSGLWRVGVSLRFAALNTGPEGDDLMPSGLVAIDKVLLVRADEPGPLVFDASTHVVSRAVGRATGTSKAIGVSKAERIPRSLANIKAGQMKQANAAKSGGKKVATAGAASLKKVTAKR